MMGKSVNKFVTTAALTLGLALGGAGSAWAQAGGDRDAGAGTGAGADAGRGGQTARTDSGFNLGWLGLIGLAGLIPLFVRRNGDAYAARTGTTTGRPAGV